MKIRVLSPAKLYRMIPETRVLSLSGTILAPHTEIEVGEPVKVTFNHERERALPLRINQVQHFILARQLDPKDKKKMYSAMIIS